MNKQQLVYWLRINSFHPKQFGPARKGIRSGSLYEKIDTNHKSKYSLRKQSTKSYRLLLPQHTEKGHADQPHNRQ